jgi:hypothetical protein
MLAFLVVTVPTVLDPPGLLALSARSSTSCRDDERHTLATRVGESVRCCGTGAPGPHGLPHRGPGTQREPCHRMMNRAVSPALQRIQRQERRRALRTTSSSRRCGGGNSGHTLPTLDNRLLHCDRARDTVELVVQPTGIALRASFLVTAPKRGGAGAAVTAAHANRRGSQSVPSRGSANLRLLVGLGGSRSLDLGLGVDVPGGVAAGPAVDVAEGLDDGALDWG